MFYEVIEFILFTLCLILLIIILKGRRTIAQLSSKYSMREEEFYKYLALAFFRNPDSLLEDRTHHFTVQKECDEIRGQDGFLSFTYRGINFSDSPSSFIREEISDDIPIELKRLEFKAIDNLSKMPLDWKVIKDETYAIIVEIYFAHPLSQAEPFDISFEYKMPGSFTKGDEEYLFYPVDSYQKKVEKLEVTVSLDSPPIHYELLRFDKGEFIAEKQPDLEIAKDRAIIKFVEHNPKGIYLLKFKRQVV